MRNTNTGWWVKWAAGGLVVLFIVIAIFGGGDTSKPSKTGTVAAAPPPPPAPVASPRDDLRAAIESTSPGDSIRIVRISGNRKAGYRITVRFDLSDNLTRGLRRAGVENDMRDVYKAIYTSSVGDDVASARIEAWTKLADQLGNEHAGSAFTTSLGGDLGNRVNWDNADILNFNNIWTQEFKLNDF